MWLAITSRPACTLILQMMTTQSLSKLRGDRCPLWLAFIQLKKCFKTLNVAFVVSAALLGLVGHNTVGQTWASSDMKKHVVSGQRKPYGWLQGGHFSDEHPVYDRHVATCLESQKRK
jgi:hypothetical protein